MGNEDEAFIYALRPGSINVDDVVLTSDFGTIPLGIRTFTGSDFSHAALCTKPDMLFEAVRDGVLRRSVLGTYAPREEWIKVLRPKRALPPNQRGLRVPDYAEALYGRAYSVRNAVASRFSGIGSADDGSAFCSMVIAEAFQSYGISLVPGKAPSQIYPGLLLTSPELMDVTSGCIRKLGSKSDSALYNCVVETAHHELPGAEMQMNRRVFEAAQNRMGKTLDRNIHSLTDLYAWLSLNFTSPEARDLDAAMITTLETEGFFKWYDEFSARVQADAAAVELAADAAEASIHQRKDAAIQALIGDLKETEPMADASLRARKQTMEEYEELARRTSLRTFARLHGVYQRQYDDADRIHRAKKRVIAALSQRKPS